MDIAPNNVINPPTIHRSRDSAGTERADVADDPAILRRAAKEPYRFLHIGVALSALAAAPVGWRNKNGPKRCADLRNSFSRQPRPQHISVAAPRRKLVSSASVFDASTSQSAVKPRPRVKVLSTWKTFFQKLKP